MGTMGELCIMDQSGDTRTIWDTENDTEVEVAREQFNMLKRKGYMIYRVNKKGDKGEQMLNFDPEAGKMIAVPKVVGG